MITAGLEPSEKSYKDLVEHLEKLEVSLPEETTPRRTRVKMLVQILQVLLKMMRRINNRSSLVKKPGVILRNPVRYTKS